MPVKDLREWIEKVEAMGELLRVNGAHWDLEIGALTDLYQQRPGSPALLFDKIPDYPEGFSGTVQFLHVPEAYCFLP